MFRICQKTSILTVVKHNERKIVNNLSLETQKL